MEQAGTLSTKKGFVKNLVRAKYLLILALLIAAPASAGEYGAVFLKDFDGAAHSLEEYTGKGQWTVMMIWASDCHACNAEAKQYVKFHTAHHEKDAALLGVSMDGNEMKDEALKFIDRHDINFPNLIDEPENIARMYTNMTGKPWVGTPTFMIFSPSGELRAAQVGAVPPHIIESFIASESAVSQAGLRLP
jgi:peroxiredoxin